MALSGCYVCVKYLVVSVNFIFWLAGLAVLGVSLWMLTDSTFYLSVTQHAQHYNTGLGLLVAVGALMFIVGFLGCCGAFKESTCMLVTFFWFLVIILVAEVAAGIWAYMNSGELTNQLRANVKHTVKEEYGLVESRTITIDAIQQGLHCCGAEGPMDWRNSKYDSRDPRNQGALDFTASAVGLNYHVPPSCCSVDGESCELARKGGFTTSVNPMIYGEGCIDKLIEELKNYINIVIGVGAVIFIIELLGLVFSLVLCCAIRNTDRYKA